MEKKEPITHELAHNLGETEDYFLYVKTYGNEGCVFVIEAELRGSEYPSILLYADTNIENVMKKWEEFKHL